MVVGYCVGAADVQKQHDADKLRDDRKPPLDLKGEEKGLPPMQAQGEHSTWDA
jgi:hypothetical protein